jgi:hypothetical protein
MGITNGERLNGAIMERIGVETLVLLADLRERLETFEAMRSIATPREN